MIKRSTQSHPSITDIQQSIEYPSCSDQQYDEYFSDYQYNWQYRKISPDDLLPFCDQLGKFLKYVRNIQDLTYLTYDYPSVLQNRLEKDTNELQCLYMEVKDAVNNIERLKQQKKLVRKEKASVKKTLKKIRDEEMREMESIISLYDKTMFARWENVKNTHKPEVLEILLNDVKGKQQALEHLNTLVSRQLGQLQLFMPLLASTENAAVTALASTNPGVPTTIAMAAGTLNNVRVNGTTGPTSIEDNRLQVPPKRHTNGSGVTRTSEYHRSNARRRRHHERQDTLNNGRFVPITIQQENNSSDLPLIPFTMSNYPFQIQMSTAVTVSTNNTESNSGSNSNHELITLTTSNADDILQNDSNTETNAVGSEFQSEMRTVLQALFGELRQTSPTALDINTDQENSDNNTNREIELYTLRKPPQ